MSDISADLNNKNRKNNTDIMIFMNSKVKFKVISSISPDPILYLKPLKNPVLFIFNEFLKLFLHINFLVILFIISVTSVKAQIPPKDSETRKRMENELQQRGEVYIAIPLTKQKAGLSLLSSFSPGQLKNDTAFFFISPGDTALLFSSDINYLPLTAPSLINQVIMASSDDEVLQGLAYPTYAQYLSIMKSFRDNYPLILTLDTIGYSVKNKLILAARIQTGKLPPENRAIVFLSSSIHGNEPPGYVILLMLLNELLQNYNTSSEISDLLDQIILIINPLANPDGAYFLNDSSLFGSTRHNFNNIDLNRNFPDPYKGWSFGGERQAETVAMMEYMNKFRPSLSANLHSGVEVVNYPWDWGERIGTGQENPHPDDAWFRMIASEYVNIARATSPEYMDLFPGGITNGAFWYVIYGGRQDYVTGFLNGREITLELSYDFIPPVSEILPLYNTNRQALINFIKQSTYGLHGKVTDSLSNKALGKVQIKLENVTDPWSFIYSDSLTGIFHRYLKAGNYKIIFKKEGYLDHYEELTITDYEKLFLEVRMTPDNLTCTPNPFSNQLYIKFLSPNQQKILIEIFSLSGQVLYSESFSAMESVNTYELKPDLHSGVYILKLTAGNENWKKKIIKFKNE